MNKNWLYRVLAMALVAMLALPVFALAEEATLTEFEAAVDEVEFDLGAEGAEEEEVVFNKDVVANYEIGEMNIWTWDEKEWDANDEVFGGADAWKSWGGFVINVSADHDSLSWKSSNKKVARVADGVVTFTGAGKATITVTAKYRPEAAKRKVTFKTKVNIKVVDPGAIDTLKSYFGDSFDEDDVKSSGHTYKVDLAEGFEDGEPTKFALPVAYNDDDDLLDYQTGGDLGKPAYLYGYKWTWSKPDIAYFRPGEDIEDPASEDYNGVWKLKQSKGYWGINWDAIGDAEEQAEWWAEVSEVIAEGGTWEDMPETVWYPDLRPVFFKPGKSTLTFKAVDDAKKKVTMNFVVAKNNASWKLKKKDIVDDEVFMTVKSITVKDMDTVEVVFAVVNGTDNFYKNYEGALSITYGADDNVFVAKEEKEYKVKAKPHAITTFKVKFENKGRSASEFVVEDGEVVTPGLNFKRWNLKVNIDEWLPANPDSTVGVKGFEIKE